jgi:hypothetical protein
MGELPWRRRRRRRRRPLLVCRVIDVTLWLLSLVVVKTKTRPANERGERRGLLETFVASSKGETASPDTALVCWPLFSSLGNGRSTQPHPFGRQRRTDFLRHGSGGHNRSYWMAAAKAGPPKTGHASRRRRCPRQARCSRITPDKVVAANGQLWDRSMMMSRN